VGATEQHNAFLDLRRIPTSGEWLKAPLLSQPLGYAPMTADWTQVLDAMVFTRIDVMLPSASRSLRRGWQWWIGCHTVS